MKTKHHEIIVCAFLFTSCAFAQTNSLSAPLVEHPAQLRVKVLDDDNNPVIGIEVAVSTFRKHIPDFGTDENKIVTQLTDANGIAILKFPCLTGEAAYGVRPFTGFYGNIGSQKIRFTDVVAAKWQPWDPTEEIRIKRILNPVPMYARRIEEKPIPEQGKAIGFDLTIGDWVGPYGKGITPDFLFKFESKPEPEVPPREPKPFDVTLTMSFPNDGDGIQSVFVPLRGVSELRLPRQAPLDGYQQTLVKHQQNERGQVPHIESRDDQNYFFRVRTKKDDRGNIVSALYGKISGNIRGGISGKLTFTYYLNPTLNDRNMEFDPKQNLFKNLPPLEQVSAP
jgi:hypothetical protein